MKKQHLRAAALLLAAAMTAGGGTTAFAAVNALIVALCMKKQNIVAKTLTELEDI